MLNKITSLIFNCISFLSKYLFNKKEKTQHEYTKIDSINSPLNSKLNKLFIDMFIDYSVIHASNIIDREENINIMSSLMNKKINKFEAIIGGNIDFNNLSIYDKNITFNFNYKTKAEVGCYLSHMMLLNSLKRSHYNYCLILEDDFKILDNQYHNKLVDIINDMDDDFDLLYLGNLNNNHGKHYKNDIYYINKNEDLYGTHAYIVKIKNINKIYNLLLDIDLAIDNKYKKLIDENKLNAFIIFPILIDISNLPTTIQLNG